MLKVWSWWWEAVYGQLKSPVCPCLEGECGELPQVPGERVRSLEMCTLKLDSSALSRGWFLSRATYECDHPPAPRENCNIWGFLCLKSLC